MTNRSFGLIELRAAVRRPDKLDGVSVALVNLDSAANRQGQLGPDATIDTHLNAHRREIGSRLSKDGHA